jgi:hypothetical protein
MAKLVCGRNRFKRNCQAKKNRKVLNNTIGNVDIGSAEVNFSGNRNTVECDNKMKSYTKQLDEWFEAEKKKGLLDIKFFVGELSDSTVESFSREALDVLNSKKTSCTQQGF